jgi:hypothetical protein
MLQPAAAGSSSRFVVYYAKQRAAGQHPVTLVRPLRWCLLLFYGPHLRTVLHRARHSPRRVSWRRDTSHSGWHHE